MTTIWLAIFSWFYFWIGIGMFAALKDVPITSYQKILGAIVWPMFLPLQWR